MKKQTQQKLIVITAMSLVAAVVVPQKASALFGFGDIVFDPTSYASLGEILSSNASMLTKAVELGQQTQSILQNATATYAKIDQASQMVQHPDRLDWLAVGSQIANHYEVDNDGAGASLGWAAALNGGGDIYHAYTRATEGLHANAHFANNVAGHDSLAASLASANIADGSLLALMKTVSTARSNQLVNDNAIRSLERLATSTAGADNTQEASLNVIGGASVQQLRMMQNQQALLASLAEANLPMNKFLRDATVADVNAATSRQIAAANNPFHVMNTDAASILQQ